MYRRYVSGGSIGSEVQRTDAAEYPISSASTGVFKDGSTWRWNYAYMQSEKYRHRYYTGSSWDLADTTGTDKYDTSPLTALYREFDDQNVRIFFSEQDDHPTAYDWDSTFRVRYNRSSDEFNTSASGSMKVCDSMSGFMSCSATSWMKSPYPVSVAYDSQNARSVTAWANYNRQDDSDDRLLQLAVGLIPNRTLPVPGDFGYKTSVGPAVACKDGAGGDDCLVAYVDQADPLGRIKVIRFHPTVTGTGYDLTKTGGPYFVGSADARTAQRIALFHHNSKWWVVFRSKRANQKLSVYRATYPWSWSLYSSDIGYSVTGPNAVSYWTGNNMLGTTR